MKVYWAEYYWSGSYGAFDKYNTVVVAESESVALGLLLQFVVIDKIPDTNAKYWTLTEINTTKAHIIENCVREGN